MAGAVIIWVLSDSPRPTVVLLGGGRTFKRHGLVALRPVEVWDAGPVLFSLVLGS
jgi:hypothetical protein